MSIDWNAVATIAASVVTGIVSIATTRWLENRPKLITYYGSVSTHHVTTQEVPQGFRVFTHEVVIANTGRKSATNIRVSHASLPNYYVMPEVPHRVEQLPGGHRDIVLDALVPGQQVTISYLYAPPLQAGSVNTGVRCDQGLAQFVPMRLTRQPPPWLMRALVALLALGLITAFYLAYLALERLL